MGIDNKLLQHIQSSPMVQAAITEAVHRFYYDRVVSLKSQDQQDLIDCDVSAILSTLWNLQPNWRFVIKKGMERYDEANTQSVPVISKPERIVGLSVEIDIK